MDLQLKHNVDYEFETGGVVYRVAKTKADIDRATAFFFDVFLEGEPLCKSRGGKKAFQSDSMRKMMRDTLMDGVSLVAVDAETDEMLGFRTAKVCCRDDQQEPRRPTVEELRQGFPEAFADISVVLDLLLWPPEFFLDFPHLHRCYYMFTLATKPECRGRGIARELLKQAFKVARKVGCDNAAVSATNPITDSLFRKMGMTEYKYYKLGEMEEMTGIHFDVDHDFVSSFYIELGNEEP